MKTEKPEYVFDEKVAAIHRVRVNVKSLAEEVRIIRKETERAGPVYRHALHLHRTGRLREEARYAQLTLAFLRGRSYQKVEQKSFIPPDPKRLVEKIGRYLRGISISQVEEWLGLKKEEPKLQVKVVIPDPPKTSRRWFSFGK